MLFDIFVIVLAFTVAAGCLLLLASAEMVGYWLT